MYLRTYAPTEDSNPALPDSLLGTWCFAFHRMPREDFDKIARLVYKVFFSAADAQLRTHAICACVDMPNHSLSSQVNPEQ